MLQILWISIFACFFQSVHLQDVSVAKNVSLPVRAATYVDMNSFRSELLYPHDPKHLLDTINNSVAIKEILLSYRLRFFGFQYSYVWIHRDGYILFNKGLKEYPSPVKFPTPYIKDPFTEEDPCLIAPWLSSQDIPDSIEGAGVYFQMVNLANEKDELLRERIKLDFKEAMIGSQDFVPTIALIITWKNMTLSNRMRERTLKTNTYQAVIATDDSRTYVMFNYDSINWISENDDYDWGKGRLPFVGFNAGNHTRAFELEPYSQNLRITRLLSLGFGNGLKGRFYFQIDEEIWPGSCIEEDLNINWSSRPKLTFFPRYGNMLGGTVVNITGPCFENPHSIIRCKFDTLETEGIYRSPNHVSCISPPVMYHGYVDLSVSIDQRPFLFYGKFYIQPPDIAEADVNVLDGSDKLEAPTQFIVQWKHEKLTQDNRAPVTISLWGFREANYSYPKLTYIDVLTDRGVVNGESQYSIDLEDIRRRWNPDKMDIYFGFIAINLSNPEVLRDGSSHTPVLWSGPLPLGWYFGHQWRQQLGSNWKANICESWYTREKHNDHFVKTLFRCPCTLAQAKLDTGRFLPDPQCNEMDRNCETFHKSAHHCVRSGRPAVGGAGQLCCYDDRGELIRTGDSVYGGHPERAFRFGKHPFKQPMIIPSLSYWLHDVSPFFFCCKWADEKDNAKTCDMYKHWRTSQDCSLYQPPMVASVFGDPHFLTFDRVNYTFNGKGEFVLTRVNEGVHKLDVQGRFEQPNPKDSTSPRINGTKLMAVAARDNISSIVEFRVRPKVARLQYQMYIIVDNEYVYFWDNSFRIQFFKGVTLYQPANIYNMSHIVAMFDSGAGLEVRIEDGHMAVHVYLPLQFENKTRGLLGNWSRTPEDDFTDPDGMVYVRPWDTTYDIHHMFGMKYRVSEVCDENVGRSLFFHNSMSFSQYDDKSFVPEYEIPPPFPENFTYSRLEVERTCAFSVACRFDFIVTGDEQLAVATRNHDFYANKLSLGLRKEVIRCPELIGPRNGRKSSFSYYVGSTVSFICNDGYILEGRENWTCRRSGLWDSGVDTQCISQKEHSRKGLSLEIILPICIVGLLLCAILLSVIMFTK